MLMGLKAGKPVRVLGAMSGTSLDGVDAAVLVTDGVSVIEPGETGYRPYSDAEQAVLRAALGKWSGPEVAAAAEVVETAHAEILSRFDGIDLVGFHGQTVAHDPAQGRTLQLGDGVVLAAFLGVPVAWDFRTADVGLGGQGAPLAPFYHHALVQASGIADPVGVLNLGGVGNLTWVDPGKALPEADGALMAFDTGPANAPINDLMQSRFGRPYDKAGEVAEAGVADEDFVARFAEHPYFLKMPPKSLDRDEFAGVVAETAKMSAPDAVATMTACAAVGVMQAIDMCPAPPKRLVVTGGGRRNPVLMDMIAASVGCDVIAAEALDWDGDMLEAQAFAYLAARIVRGLPTSCPGTTGVQAAVGGGEVSLPSG